MLVVTPNLCFDRTLWVEAVRGRHRLPAAPRPRRCGRQGRQRGARTALPGHDAPAARPASPRGRRPLRQAARRRGTVVAPGRGRRQRPGGDHRRRGLGTRHGPQRAGSRPSEPSSRRPCSSGSRRSSAPVPVRVVACSGSLPPGLPDDTYGRVVEIVRRHGGTVVVDGARAALAASLAFAPDWSPPTWPRRRGCSRARTLEPPHEEASLEARPGRRVRGRPRPARARSTARGRHRRRPRRRLGRRRRHRDVARRPRGTARQPHRRRRRVRGGLCCGAWPGTGDRLAGRRRQRHRGRRCRRRARGRRLPRPRAGRGAARDACRLRGGRTDEAPHAARRRRRGGGQHQDRLARGPRRGQRAAPRSATGCKRPSRRSTTCPTAWPAR